MENNKMNILVEFEIGGEPIRFPYSTSDKFEIGNEESAFTAVCTVLGYTSESRQRFRSKLKNSF